MVSSAPRRPPARRRDERGIVLYMVLVAVLLLFAAGAVLSMHLQRRTSIFHHQERNLHAQCLLDSGTAQALALMAQNHQYQGTQTLEIDGGSVRIEVRYTGKTGVRDVLLRSSYRGKSRRVLAEVEVEKDRPPRVRSWRPVSAAYAE